MIDESAWLRLGIKTQRNSASLCTWQSLCLQSWIRQRNALV